MFFVTADIAGGTASLAVAKRVGGSMYRPLVEFPHGSAEKAEIIILGIHLILPFNMGMGQYRYIFSGLFTSINPSYDLGEQKVPGFWPIPIYLHIIHRIIPIDIPDHLTYIHRYTQ